MDTVCLQVTNQEQGMGGIEEARFSIMTGTPTISWGHPLLGLHILILKGMLIRQAGLERRNQMTMPPSQTSSKS